MPEARCDEPQQTAAGAAARGAGRGDAPAPPRNKTLYFEYDMATARVSLLEDYKPEPRQLRWASLSPDSKIVLFARNHNLFMMDAENYAKAQKNANDATIVEVQLTTDGEEYYGYSAAAAGARTRRISSSNSNNSSRTTSNSRNSARTSTPRTRASPPRP